MRVPWLCFLAACGSPPPPVPAPPKPPPPPSLANIAGVWSGMGYQADVEARVEVQLELDDAPITARVGTITYPLSNCSAVLTRLEAPRTELRAREQMVSNPDNACIDGGTIIVPLTPNVDGLDFRWLFPDGRVGVTATLAR